MLKLNDAQLLTARQETQLVVAVGKKDFPKLNLKTPLEFFKTNLNTSFEELGCLGYNPDMKELTAIVKIKKQSGYGGVLCGPGSYEYVRFYLDYGSGWEDMGYVGFNVHDIPTKNDCEGHPEKPIDYAIRLKIEPKPKYCKTPVLPKVKAVLSWNSIPMANDPNLTSGSYYWGDVKEDQIQIKALKQIPEIIYPGLEELMLFAIKNPELSLKDLASKDLIDQEALDKAKKLIAPKQAEFGELVEMYKDKDVEPQRMGHNLLKEAETTTDPGSLGDIFKLFDANNLSMVESLNMMKDTKCNTSYEELFCIGADYNQEALVGTLRIKRPYGYGGNLCQTGSKEYVSFWIQDEPKCNWEPLGTASIDAHDIHNIPNNGLSYSVILPYDFSGFKDSCDNPRVLKIRAVLSWNSVPQSMNCSNWGNVIESYIQIQPKVKWDKKSPKIITVGGVSVDNIDPVSGLTLPGAKIEFNKTNTYSHSPFGGIIVVQGVSAPLAGNKYKVKITNLANGGSYYLNNSLALLGYSGSGITHPVIYPSGYEYEYQPYHNNINNVLARFSPGTNDRIMVTIEHANGTSHSQIIQMDNSFPVLSMSIDDNGNCSHYPKGGTIKGEFSVNDNYLQSYAITTSVGIYTKVGTGLGQSGTQNGTGKFDITTYTDKNCGSIYLKAIQKTIWNSVRTGTYRDIQKIVCLA